MVFDKNSEFALKYLSLSGGKISTIRGTDQDDTISVKCILDDSSKPQICNIAVNNDSIDVSYNQIITTGLSIFGHKGNDSITFVATGHAIFSNVNIWADEGDNRIHLNFNWPKVSATLNLGFGKNEIHSKPLGEALILSGIENNPANKFHVYNVKSSEHFLVQNSIASHLLDVFYGEKQVCQIYESHNLISQNHSEYSCLANFFDVTLDYY